MNSHADHDRGDLNEETCASPTPQFLPGFAVERETIQRERIRVRVAGAHSTEHGEEFSVSEASFAASVVDNLPQDLLYKRGDAVGMIDLDSSEPKFTATTITRLQLVVSERISFWQTRMTLLGYQEQVRAVTAERMKLVREHALASNHVRKLERLVSYPIITGPDFEIAAPGWNQTSGTFFVALGDIIGITATTIPSGEAGNRLVRDALEDLVIDFPFEDEASRQNFYGLLLTPILRPAIDGNVPIHILDAPIERSGKSKLCEEVLGRIILGRKTPAMQIGKTEEETEKRITSFLRQGESIIHLDNISDIIDSPSIASLLTCGYWNGRVLGKSEIVSIKNEVVLMASGNNLLASSENAKRSVPIRIVPLDDKPELRSDFVHGDLPSFLTTSRRRILGILLGMVQRWREDGAPRRQVPFGGFENWAGVIGGVLESFGFTDFMSNRDRWLRTADTNSQDLVRLVNAWLEAHGTETLVVAGQLINLLPEGDEFRDIIERASAGRTVALGRKLRRLRDRPIKGYLIKNRPFGNTTQYWLEPVRSTGGMEEWRISPSALRPISTIPDSTNAGGGQ